MKSLISYYGGKSRIASRIVEEINQIHHSAYVEPYAGGASVLFAKPRRHVKNAQHYREVINDISNELVTLYRVAVEQPETLALKLEATLYSQSDHKKAAQILKDSASYDDLTIAWAYFVSANCSFSHQVGAGWSVSVASENSAFTWHGRILRLRQTLERLQSVHVSCEDALNCVDRWDSPHTLFYLDPPYPGANQGHYKGFTVEDWIALCDKLDTIQGSYILSNYSQDCEPKSAQQKKEIVAAMSAGGNTRLDRSGEPISRGEESDRVECLWIKVATTGGRKEINRMLEGSQLSLLV